MLSSVLGLVLGAILQAVNEWLSKRRAESTLKQLGEAEAVVRTQEIIARKADEQVAVNSKDRGGKDAVAARIRESLRGGKAADPQG